MKLPLKKKILFAALSFLTAALVCVGLFWAWSSLRLACAEQAAADNARFEAQLLAADERVESLRTQRALDAENAAREKLVRAFSERADSFTDSLLVLVNPWNEVPENYSVQLGEVEGYLVDRRAAGALRDMLADCRAAGFEPVICSAYRTMEYQEMLYRNKILRLLAEGVPNKDAPAIAARSVALPGTSEHQLGLAVDLISETYTNLDQWQEYTAVQQWFMANCYDYGFILRYPNGTSDITGIIYEPWHYRYVGAVTAQAVKESGLVFEEYLKTTEQ